MKLRSLVASLACVVALCTAAFAADDPTLAAWKGEYVSVEAYWADARTDDFYAKIAEEAKKQGKEATAEGTKKSMLHRYYAPFTACTIDENTITFKMKDGSERKVEYVYAGSIKGGKGSWTWFKAADEKDLANFDLSNIVMTVNHGTPAHFHFRIGSANGATLMSDPRLADWHGTMNAGAADYDAYMKNFDAARYVKFAL